MQNRPITIALFDLDCTLYPPESGLLAQVDRNITHAIEVMLGLPYDEADRLRLRYHLDFGTTLRGLQELHGITPADYYAIVYDLNPADFVQPDPRVRAVVCGCGARRRIFTNGTQSYACRVLRALELEDLFPVVYDIGFADYQGKPMAEAYDAVLRAESATPAECLVIDDQRRNVAAGVALGMRGAWVDWSADAAHDEPDVDWVVPSVLHLPTAYPAVFSATPRGPQTGCRR